MNRMTSILVAAALASLSAGALAADDPDEGVRDQAKATYEMDKKGCQPLQGDERRNCLRRAKAQYNQAITEARRMKAEQKEDKAAQRADERDRKKRLDVGSGGHRSRGDSASGASQRPAAGAQSGTERTAPPEPGKNMGRAPVSAGGTPGN